ncbi:DUF4265 domain-containing protein [Tautonia sociabilis]|uniref:DUF4265 domain-containing protein n=1 Tax=Tautonia sociabilis TaxID=2080755 RepID=A0A432ML90_9BACT|nr:DUF4265 domain-containing protein [Tautonia sociabilis]RUL87905.1 DUF4265 domain-containing protein [Tautonia sociabilis]
MSGERHLLLLIEYRQGQPIKEPVHVDEISPGRFRLCASPGLVQGIAAGDEFRMLGDDGAFEVIRRGGNLAVQLFALEPVAPYQEELVARVARLGGTLDGAIERGLVFTVPVSVGFAAVEELFEGWVAEHEGWEWLFGNVYDPADGVTPLGWWDAPPTGSRDHPPPPRGLRARLAAIFGRRAH